MTRFRPSYSPTHAARSTPRRKRVLSAFATFIAVAALAGVAGNAGAQAVYPTPEQAAEALQQAIALQDETALKKVLGANFHQFIPAGSVDQDDIYAFLGAYARHHEIVKNGERVAHLQAGDSGWTLPIPIEKISKGWQFDLRQAHDEMADRRVGRNELSAIQTVLAIGDAQRDFAQAQGSTVYAQRFVSRPGKRDGLYWPIADNEPESPLGALAAVMNPNAPPGEAYHGYHYRILTAQGTHAPGGAHSYLENGRMSGGYAVVAWPAKYGDTGVMTFIAGSDGKVYQRNLGPQTASAAAGITTFDPGPGWEAAPDSAVSAQ